MNSLSYWKKQTSFSPLYPAIEWNKPERRDQAGKLLIVGGNKLGFAAVAFSYEAAKQAGAGVVQALLPDCLTPVIPKTLDNVLFGACTPSGGLSHEASTTLLSAAKFSDGVLLIGDSGRNSETAILYERFINDYAGPLTITRDAVDIVRNSSENFINRPNTIIIVSFAQLQKLFQAVYYPKMLTFSMQLMQLVETLHKFTITYSCTVMTLHQDQLVIAHNGHIVTQEWGDASALWSGETAARASSYWLWNLSQPFESTVASIA